ncbi:glycosyltransferase [Fulvivirgaceae bacterium BMA10]|uniref:Glycosyltransferase n=1 Tax=Splendidivirga corallicola TaxID=3051826 RepID=A0ABT8KZQ9_9BACT|nr:glycosyltransferase [Fulvivirgaceae bacterium BMA10]
MIPEKIDTCIVIPCFNEEAGLDLQTYRSFVLNSPNTMLCFVNDGSTDNTADMLQEIAWGLEQQVHILSLKRNVGKAEAVRKGILHCNTYYDHLFIGYLDADLSTTLNEFQEMTNYLKEGVDFAFGSRIMKIGSVIERNNFRFFTGRIIATFISKILDIRVYDTQCGCKIFTKELSNLLFKERFISRWLFDVELFFRMLLKYDKKTALIKMIEVPLKRWIDEGNSKVKISYFFKLWIDLFKINSYYKTLLHEYSGQPILRQESYAQR